MPTYFGLAFEGKTHRAILLIAGVGSRPCPLPS